VSTKRELPMALRAAYLGLHRRTEACLAAEGVTADQFVMLARLAEGRALTQRELARRISSDPSTVRAMLVLLERRGLVRRPVHPGDARARTVALTAAGRRLLERLWILGEPIRSRMAAALSQREAAELVKLLRRLTEVLSSDEASSNGTPVVSEEVITEGVR
jgi:DNA-binding MarR family transcriptional regulator